MQEKNQGIMYHGPLGPHHEIAKAARAISFEIRHRLPVFGRCTADVLLTRSPLEVWHHETCKVNHRTTKSSSEVN